MQKLVSVYRGPLEESSHYGYLVVVNDQGQVVHQLGDPQFETYIRSAAKPLQVIPLLLETLDEKYGFTAEEIAVMCGSHGGEAIHRQAVSSILDKIGLSPEHLLCGIHRPFSPSENRLLRLSGAEPTTLHNNCSGKHAAMLALSVHFNYDTAQYLNPEHPVQKLLLSTVSLFAGIDVDAVHIGVDGCGVPVFGMPLVNMARAYAKLVRPQKLPPGYAQACEKVVTAITANPQMISATHDLDYRLMATNPGVVAKIGAEAVYCLALPEKGLAAALKIVDGHKRAIGPAVIALLDQLKALSPSQLEQLKQFSHPKIQNNRGETIGHLAVAFSLSSGS